MIQPPRHFLFPSLPSGLARTGDTAEALGVPLVFSGSTPTNGTWKATSPAVPAGGTTVASAAFGSINLVDGSGSAVTLGVMPVTGIGVGSQTLTIAFTASSSTNRKLRVISLTSGVNATVTSVDVAAAAASATYSVVNSTGAPSAATFIFQLS